MVNKFKFKDHNNNLKRVAIKQSDFFISKFRNVLIIPQFEIFFSNKDSVINYKLKDLDAPYLDSIISDRKNDFFLKRSFFKKLHQVENCFAITSRFSENYIHFILEHATQILEIKKFSQKKGIELTFLLNDNIYDTLKDLVRTIIPNEKIIYSNFDNLFEVQNLYTCSPIFEWGTEDLDFKITNPYNCNFLKIKNLRDYVLKKYINNKVYPEKIYIKQFSNYRKFLNGEDLIKKLPSNYKVIDTNLLSFEDQVNYFYKAKNIVCCWGAANANLLFTKENCNVKMIVINTKYTVSYVWNILSKISKFNLVFYKAIFKAKDNFVNQSDFEINIKNFEF